MDFVVKYLNVYVNTIYGDNMVKEEIPENEVMEKLKEAETTKERLPIYTFSKVGDFLIGKVLDIRTVPTRVGERKLMEIRTKKGDFALWLSHKVLEQEIERKGIKAGDIVGIKYLGREQGKRYYNYIVVKV